MEQSKNLASEGAFEEALKYFAGDELAVRVRVNKYSMRDSFGDIYEELPEDIYCRIVNEVARVEKKYKNPMSTHEIFNLLDHSKYVIPVGNPMIGIDNNHQVASLGNCFTIGLDGDADSYGAIMRIDEKQIQLIKRRGGVGHDLSHIRPENSLVNNSALTSTGLVPFMKRYSDSTCEVVQDGRRGVLMLNVNIKHPDSETFIDTKMTEGKITGANVSVKIDDVFMEATISDKPYVQQLPVDNDELLVKWEISARALWEKIVHNAWKSAESGVLSWDTITRESIPDCYADLGFHTVSTNPCGEIPLCPYDSRHLSSINLHSYMVRLLTKDAYFDMDKFRKYVQIVQRIMGDIVDLELGRIDRIMQRIQQDPQSDEVKGLGYYPWKKIKHKSSQERRTGAGITAGGDMIVAMGSCYGTSEATEFSVNTYKNLALSAYRSSVTVAQGRGVLAVFDASREKNNPSLFRIKEADQQLYADLQKHDRRNIVCLTITSTGTASLITQTTDGIEPVFMPMYKRCWKVDPNDTDAHVDFVDEAGDSFEEYIAYHKKFLEWMNVNGIDSTKKYTQKEIGKLVTQSPYYRATANDVDWLEKVEMQGVTQKWVDHNISVTINLPSDVDEALVNRLYVGAWKGGHKGCTIYRNGPRTGVIIPVSKSEKKQEDKERIRDNGAGQNTPSPCKQPEVIEVRPEVLECDVVRSQNNREKQVAFVGLFDGYPCEIFTSLQDDDEGVMLPKSVVKGKVVEQKQDDDPSGYDPQLEDRRGYKTTVEGFSEKFNPECWDYAKFINGVLRYRTSIERVINLVSSLQLKDKSINTWKSDVGRALRKYIGDGAEAKGKKCPMCGHRTLVYQEGCLICKNCGASRCG